MSGPSEPFAAMVARLGKIDLAEFAGAVVVVPPGDGEIIAVLMADPNPSALQFWSTVKARVEAAVTQVLAEEQARAGQMGYRR